MLRGRQWSSGSGNPIESLALGVAIASSVVSRYAASITLTSQHLYMLSAGFLDMPHHDNTPQKSLSYHLTDNQCDESKPTCKRCMASDFTCNYVKSAETLQLAHTNTFRVDLSPKRWPGHPQFRVPLITPVDGRLDSYDLRPCDIAAISRFQQRTAWTISDGRVTSIYAPRAIRLGSTVSLSFADLYRRSLDS